MKVHVFSPGNFLVWGVNVMKCPERGKNEKKSRGKDAATARVAE